MVIIIESLIGILLFTILIVPLTLKNPLISVGDYPTAIREKCIELGLIEKREQRFTRADIIRKGTALVVFVIPGTEDMDEYRDYRFHIRQSCIGMLLGLPACLGVGALTVLL